MNSLRRSYRLLLNIFGDIHLERLEFNLFHAEKLRNVIACIVTAAEQTKKVFRRATKCLRHWRRRWSHLASIASRREQQFVVCFELKEIGIVVSV